MVRIPPPASVTPVTVITWPETPTAPPPPLAVVAVVYPAALPVSDGALHPAGTVISTAPFVMSPAAAVYVKVNVLPGAEATVVSGDVTTEFVPEPSAAFTFSIGDDAMGVNV